RVASERKRAGLLGARSRRGRTEADAGPARRSSTARGCLGVDRHPQRRASLGAILNPLRRCATGFTHFRAGFPRQKRIPCSNAKISLLERKNSLKAQKKFPARPRKAQFSDPWMLERSQRRPRARRLRLEASPACRRPWRT